MFPLAAPHVHEPSFSVFETDGKLFIVRQSNTTMVPLREDLTQLEQLVFISAGKKTWCSAAGTYTLGPGQAIYIKKEAYTDVVQPVPTEVYSALSFFFPPEFINDTVLEFRDGRPYQIQPILNFDLIDVQVNENMQAFFASVLRYVSQNERPFGHMLKLKFKELVLHILSSPHNAQLAGYFMSGMKEQQVSMEKIMQNNLLEPHSLEDYAAMCNRSLSSFKRDFKTIFGVSPGKWINENRLKVARKRLLSTKEPINDIAFHAGFETTSHFIRSFKKQFGLPPLQYRYQACA